jgi:GntR family transcriptional regulator, histidine utilization repressor
MTNGKPTSTPAYQQLKEYVLGQIASEQWRAGDVIPGEHELAKQFGIARGTVNRALRELVTERVLMRVQGAGTFVTDSRYQSTLIEIRSISEEIKSRGDEHTSEVLLLEQTQDPKVLETLAIPADGVAFHSRIVHFENGVPIQLEDRQVNGALYPDYIHQDFSRQTPNEYMTSVAPAQGVQYWITARQASATARQVLRMPIGEPCLVLHRRTWARGQVATDVMLWHPASRYELSGKF